MGLVERIQAHHAQHTLLRDMQREINDFLPHIEERIGRPLPAVQVKRHNRLKRDIAYRIRKGVLDVGGSVRRDQDLIDEYCERIWSKLNASNPVLSAPFNNIYVNFDHVSVASLYDPPLRKKALLHELGHTVWDAFRDVNNHSSAEGFAEWSEGFAVYCERDWFADFVPGIYLEYDLPHYEIGYVKTLLLVEKYGKEVLYRIPTEWPSLARDVPTFTIA